MSAAPPIRPEPPELEALLTLLLTPGLGPVAVGEMIRAHGSARRAVVAERAALREAVATAAERRRLRGWLDRARSTIERTGAHVLTPAASGYPARLGELHDPPPVLFAAGELELLDREAVAVVGSRRCTDYGRLAARRIAEGLGHAGVVVVSGLARGIDAAAHRGALETGTIAVLGCGIDVAYPRSNTELQASIEERGLLLTEFPPGAPVLRHNFPRRNRILAALARGVVVVEAAVRSGALITVEHGTDLGREIFAVPGPVDRPTSAGTNALIRDGARLVTDAADVLEELGLAGPAAGAPAPHAPTLAAAELEIWNRLGGGPVHVDQLARSAGVPTGRMLASLLALEIRGHVRQLPGLRFARVA